MYGVRRIHLYSGLMLFPWALLYGVSALLFNHPSAFPDRPTRTLHAVDFEGTALQQGYDPAADARLVVAALNARLGSSSDDIRCRLVEPEKARYTRSRISARARGAGQEHAIALELAGHTALVATTVQPPTEAAPFAARGLKVPDALADRIKAGLPTALQRQGLQADEVGIAIGAELEFFVECKGQLWRARHNIQTGAVTGAAATVEPEFSLRSFLTRLHVTHGYPHDAGWSWMWAIGVDAMAAAVLFWAASGLLMAWQIKRVRRAGALVVAASLLLAGLLALGMHQTIGAL